MPQRSMLHEEIQKRFLPDRDEKDATYHLFSTLETSKQTYLAPAVSDWFHYHKSEATVNQYSDYVYSQLSSTAQSLYEGAMDLLNNFK